MAFSEWCTTASSAVESVRSTSVSLCDRPMPGYVLASPIQPPARWVRPHREQSATEPIGMPYPRALFQPAAASPSPPASISGPPV
jgi:hypothetical protein